MLCFVKQKTAYDMRISDWSSDVCSSDLRKLGLLAGSGEFAKGDAAFGLEADIDQCDVIFDCGDDALDHTASKGGAFTEGFIEKCREIVAGRHRSEEHTSELQSLMRNSYAVFSLKKTKNRHTMIRTDKQIHN